MDAEYHEARVHEECLLARDAKGRDRAIHIALANCHANAAWLIRDREKAGREQAGANLH